MVEEFIELEEFNGWYLHDDNKKLYYAGLLPNGDVKTTDKYEESYIFYDKELSWMIMHLLNKLGYSFTVHDEN